LSSISLDNFIKERHETIKPDYSHRNIDVDETYAKVQEIYVPVNVINKVSDDRGEK
jgi:hypothetical protein